MLFQVNVELPTSALLCRKYLPAIKTLKIIYLDLEKEKPTKKYILSRFGIHQT